jgi:hypothetical protein
MAIDESKQLMMLLFRTRTDTVSAADAPPRINDRVERRWLEEPGFAGFVQSLYALPFDLCASAEVPPDERQYRH